MINVKKLLVFHIKMIHVWYFLFLLMAKLNLHYTSVKLENLPLNPLLPTYCTKSISRWAFNSCTSVS